MVNLIEDAHLSIPRQNCCGEEADMGVDCMEDWIIFFAWSGSNIWHPPVPLIEDDCAA